MSIRTITIDTNNVFTFTSSDTVQQHLQWKLQNGARVLTVTRPLFSAHFLITVDAFERTPDQWLTEYIADGMHELGFSNIAIVSIEDGYGSSDPGGLGGAIHSAGQGIQDYTKTIITPIAVVAGVLLLVVLLVELPKKE